MKAYNKTNKNLKFIIMFFIAVIHLSYEQRIHTHTERVRENRQKSVQSESVHRMGKQTEKNYRCEAYFCSLSLSLSLCLLPRLSVDVAHDFFMFELLTILRFGWVTFKRALRARVMITDKQCNEPISLD